ncbi:unnamed protein product [Brassica oleracea]
MIRFNDLTSFDEITEPVSTLPEEGFWFCNQTESVGLANTNTQLPGAFGCFDGVMTKLHNLRAAEAGQMLGGNNGDDADMHGNKFPYQVETGERSSDGDKNVKENLTAAAPKKRTHRPTYATKKAPIA